MSQESAIRILCVDDEPEVLKALRRVFRSHRYDVTVVEDPTRAIELIKSEPWNVVISDMRMPEIDGAQVLATASEHAPECVRILLSGFSDADALSRAVNDGRIHCFIHKPWDNKELVKLVDQQYNRQHLALQKALIDRELQSLSDQQKERQEDLEKQLNLQQIELVNAGYVIDMAEGRIHSAFKNTYRMLSCITQKRTGRSPNFSFSMVRHAVAIGKKFKLSKDSVKSLGMAASLAEFGKIFFPENLINCSENKIPSSLENEYKKYPSVAADLLTPISGMELVSKILRQYRELLDGTGFPNKLKEHQINLESKILSVIFFYLYNTDDSLKLEKVNHENACMELKALSGRKFDEEVVTVYLDTLPDLKQLEKPRDECVGSFNLVAGQIISRDLLSKSGMLLLSTGTELTSGLIERLKVFEHQHKETLTINIWDHKSI